MSALLPHSDAYWCGRLAMAVAVAQRAPQAAREALEEFVRSPLPTPELRDMLREEMKKKK